MVDDLNDNAELINAYKKIEKKVFIRELNTSTTYSSPVNFVESMKKPRHRWFPYKEGFSPLFVYEYLNSSPGETTGFFLDPFSGSGTAPLVAAELNYQSIGIDVSPLTNFVSNTKSTILSPSDVSAFAETIRNFKLSKLEDTSSSPDNQTVQKYFQPSVLDLILKVKAFYQNISDDRIAALFKLAMLTSVEPLSTHRKAGNGVKRKTRYSLPENSNELVDHVKQFISSALEMFLDDLKNARDFKPPVFTLGSSLEPKTLQNLDNISAVLTSPPYANCFDYSKIYMSELWLGDFFTSKSDQVSFREQSLRSHVHATWSDRNQAFGSNIVNDLIRPKLEVQKLWSTKIGGMLSGYFKDLGKLLVELKPRLTKDARVGLVVGNSIYGGIPVATDLLLADLGTNLGYKVEEVRVYRGVIPSSQQFKLLGQNKKYMRESLVVLRNE